MSDDVAARIATRPDLVAVRLVAPVALGILIISAMLAVSGPSESKEMKFWILAFLVALPGGLSLGARQVSMLATAAPAAAVRALAGAVCLVGFALLFRNSGAPDRGHHLVVFFAAAGAIAAPLLAARRWPSPDDDASAAPLVLTLVALALTAVLFVPPVAHANHTLEGAGAFVVLTIAGVNFEGRSRLVGRWSYLIDVAAAVVLVLVVATLPDLRASAGVTAAYHHDFFLGPVNDVLHGRAMLDGAWSQYGTGLIDTLAAVFKVVPLGYGGLFLVGVASMCAEYVFAFVTLRLAGVGRVLTIGAMVTAVLGNIFATQLVYAAFPSVTAIRFGIPFALVLVAVAGARLSARRRLAFGAQLALVATAAAWSFETWAYTAGTFALLAIVDAIAELSRPAVIRAVIRRGAMAVGASAVGVALFSLATIVLSGGLDWGPYLSYLKLYTTGGLGQLPIPLFSTGPLMALAIFLSTVAILYVALEQPQAVARETRTAIAGFSGFAATSFTYYVGRSHPNNLLNLLVPTVALGFLWIHVLIRCEPRSVQRWTAYALVACAGLIGGFSIPALRTKWKDTAFAQAVPFADGASSGQGRSLHTSLSRLWHNPVLDSRAPEGVALLTRYVPGHGRAMVMTEPDLTTEILVRARRANLLPMSHPSEDDLIASGVNRVLAAVGRVPPGTLLLTSDPPAPTPGSLQTFPAIETRALAVLHARFTFAPVARSASGLLVVRLTAR